MTCSPGRYGPTGCTSPVLPGRSAEDAEILRPWPSSSSAGPFRLSERVKGSSSATKNSSSCREQMNAGLIDVDGPLPWILTLVQQPVRLAIKLGLTLTSSRVLLLSTCRWAWLTTHRHSGPHYVCNPCPHARFSHVATACVSSPSHWAVSIGSPVQRDMVPVRYLSVPALNVSYEDCSLKKKPWIRQIGDNLSLDTVLLGACFRARLQLRRA